MDARIRSALERCRSVVITTIGRLSGRPRRIEIWSHQMDGQVYITGRPDRRDWYTNLIVNPEFILHLDDLQADLRARATPVIDPIKRRLVLSRILHNRGQSGELDTWIANSPLVAVHFEFVELCDESAGDTRAA
jgi:hypothetical protein